MQNAAIALIPALVAITLGSCAGACPQNARTGEPAVALIYNEAEIFGPAPDLTADEQDGMIDIRAQPKPVRAGSEPSRRPR